MNCSFSIVLIAIAHGADTIRLRPLLHRPSPRILVARCPRSFLIGDGPYAHSSARQSAQVNSQWAWGWAHRRVIQFTTLGD